MNQEKNFERIVPENLFDSGDLKILICYLIDSVGEAIPATETAQLFHYEGIANYFDVQTALYEWEQDGYITAGHEKGLYAITAKGSSLGNTLKENISISLRTKVYNAVIKMLARYKYKRDSDITIEAQAGGTLLTCRMANAETTLFSYSILLPNESQANTLKEQILKDKEADK